MILDFSQRHPAGHYDFCIVGSGPAGITIAMKLARGGKRVLVLEGGDTQLTQRSQDLYKGAITGDAYYPLDEARLRYFGGTSNHWSGWCRPLDAFDFEPKRFRPLASWPINKADLDPYWGEARSILGIDEFPADERLNPFLDHAQFAIAPVRFAQQYGSVLREETEIELYLNANVAALRADDDRVTAIEVATWTGEKLDVDADVYVLAAGGIENSRLLLWSNDLANGRLLPAGAPVGRYWMDTPIAIIGQVVVVAEDEFPEVTRNMLFVPTRAALIEDESLSCGLYLRPVDYGGAKALLSGLACVAPETARRAAVRLGQGLVCGFALEAAWAQDPIESSRVELSSERDRFDVPRVNLHWKKSTFDIHTLRTAGERLARYFADRDWARVHLDKWVVEEAEFPADGVTGNYHHMGGTRMSDSPATGVVDRNCRLFGKDNLYIAGSSVFPAAGHVNPTFTILQLALRLGDHLLQA